MATDDKITTSLEVDVTQFKKGLSDASRAIRLANSEFDAATAGMGKWSDSADGLRAKLGQLDKTLGAQEDALSVLRSEYDRVVQAQGEGSKGAEELAIKINKQEAAVKKTKSAISKYNDDLEHLDDSNEEAADSTEDVGHSFSGIASGAKKAASAAGTLAVNLAKVAGKTIITGLKAVATASAGLVTAFLATAETSKEWISNMNKLESAAVGAGRSTEDAKQQFTEFYGILGDETATVTTVNNLSAIGMSEENLASITNSMTGIWAKYGDSIPLDGLAESINETSRVAQVTGNLADALNWAGVNEDTFNDQLAACSTEAERQQLIVDTLNGVYGKLGKTYAEQNANIIESNKAQAELNSVMAEIGNSAMPVMTAFKLIGASVLTDLLPNIKQLGESFKGILSGSQEAAAGMGTAVAGIIQQLVGKFAEALPTILAVGASIITSLVNGIITAAPSLASGVQQIIQYFTSAAPQMLTAAGAMIQNLVQGFTNALPSILATGANILVSLLTGLASAIPNLLTTASDIITNFVTAIQANLPAILAAGGEVVFQLLNGIITRLPDIVSGAVNLIGSFVSGLQENLPKVLEKGSELVGKLGEGIKNNLPELVSNALDIIMNFAETIYDNFPTIIDTGFELLSNLVQGILDALPDFIAKAPEIISKFANTINDNFPKILKKGVELIGQIIKGIIQAIPTLIKNIPKIITAIVEVWEAFNWVNLGKKAITFMKDGILKMVSGLKSAGKNVLEAVTNVVKDLPGKLKSFGSDAIKGLGDALKNGWSTVKSGAVSLFNNIVGYFKDLPSKLLGIGKDLVKGLWNGISDMTGWIIDKIEGFGDRVLDGIKDFFGIASPSKLMEDEVGAWIPRGMAKGITGGQKYVDSAMTELAKSALGNAALSGGTPKASVQTAQNSGTSRAAGNPTYVFNQYNTSPKALSRAEIYRQTKNQLRFASATT